MKEYRTLIKRINNAGNKSVLLVGAVIGYETRHGTEENLAHRRAKVVSHFQKDFAVGGSNGTHKVDGITLEVILRHIALKKAPELMGNQIVDIGTVQMLAQEERVGTQVARCRWVVEHGIEHLGRRDLVFLKESIGQFLRSKPLERIAQEHAAQCGVCDKNRKNMQKIT